MAEGLVDRPPPLPEPEDVATDIRDCASKDDRDLFSQPLGRGSCCCCCCCWLNPPAGEVGVRSPLPDELPVFELLELLRFRKLNGLIPLLLLGEC